MKKLISIFIIIICFISNSEGSTLENLYLESRLISNFENDLYQNPDDFVIGNREGPSQLLNSLIITAAIANGR